MLASDRSLPSSPAPNSTPEESLKFYKSQYELLEAELADFQSSSKDLESELERDIEQAEKRERKLKEQVEDLRYQVDEWKEKHKQAKGEANSAQAALEREVKGLRQEVLGFRQRVRDIEVANDDYERKARTTEVSLEDMEGRYQMAVERGVILEEEVRVGEQERERLRIEAQRLKDEFADYRIESEIVRKRLERAEGELAGKRGSLTISPYVGVQASPRSELSPTTTEASGPSFDTPLKKSATSSSVSDTPTPPSPPTSDKLPVTPQPFATPLPKSRLSIPTASATPRQPPLSSRANGHTRGASIAATGRTQPTSTYRQSIGKASLPVRHPNIPAAGIPKSSSIIQLRNLRGKMQNLEERVQKARSKLPAPVDTPPRGSPRSGSALSNYMPASVTVRSKRRTGTSILTGQDSEEAPSTPSIPRTKPSRQSLGRPASPTRSTMAAPPRPSSRVSAVSHRTSMSQYQPGHSRPTSRTSISGLRGLANGNQFTLNASTDRVRPHSSLSNQGPSNYDGTFDEEDEDGNIDSSILSKTPRRSTFAKRTSDVGTAIPTPGTSTKRTSIGGSSRLPALNRRQSSGIPSRPPSRQVLDEVQEG